MSDYDTLLRLERTRDELSDRIDQPVEDLWEAIYDLRRQLNEKEEL